MGGLGYKDFVNGTVADANEADGYLMQQTMMVFTNIAARDAALAGVVSDGMHCYTVADNMAWIYVGAAWREMLPRFIVATGNIDTNTAATYSDVTGFSFPAKNGGKYAIDCDLFITNAGTATADLRFGFTWTGSGVMSAGLGGNDSTLGAGTSAGTWTGHAQVAAAASPMDITGVIGVNNTLPVLGLIRATFECTADGVVQLRFRQDVANAFVSRIQRGSRMRVQRAA